MAPIHKVEMDHSGSDRDGLILSTDGLGPCIGVAVGYKDRMFLLHTADPLGAPGDFEKFLALLDVAIPLEAKKHVRPVLAGGALEDYPFRKAEIHEDTSASRQHAFDSLKARGFGDPICFWGKNESEFGQTLRIDGTSRCIMVAPVDGKCMVVNYQ